MKYLISSCLLGEPVRWHGKKANIPKIVKDILKGQEDLFKPESEKAEIIPVCPELLAGFGVPRKPVKRVKGRIFQTVPEKELRPIKTFDDVTEDFIAGAYKTLEIAQTQKVDVCILCSFSPSCDKGGVTGSLLIRNGFKVINTI